MVYSDNQVTEIQIFIKMLKIWRAVRELEVMDTDIPANTKAPDQPFKDRMRLYINALCPMSS